jgi:hypothetical protein
MVVDGDDEDFTYQLQADAVLDADTYGHLGSFSTMFTDQWADQNPGDSFCLRGNHMQEEVLKVQGIAPPTEDSLL